MKHEVLSGQTDYTVLVKVRDTAGAAKTGLTEASIDIAYARVETDNDVTTTDVTPAALTALTDAHTDWGFEEVSATDHPGLYRLDIADAVFAAGAWSAVVTITGTGLDPADLEFVMVPNSPLTGVLLAPTTHTSAVIPTVTTVGTLTTYTGNTVQTGDSFARIGATGSGLTSLASQASVNTIDDFLDTEIAAILADTNELQTDWVNGGRLDLLIDAIKAKTDNLPADPADASDIAAAIAALNDLSAAEVNAEVVDALATDTYPEPTGVPAATLALSAKISWLFMALRNGLTVTSTKKQFLDDGGLAEWEKDLSDDGTTYTESEGNAP